MSELLCAITGVSLKERYAKFERTETSARLMNNGRARYVILSQLLKDLGKQDLEAFRRAFRDRIKHPTSAETEAGAEFSHDVSDLVELPSLLGERLTAMYAPRPPAVSIPAAAMAASLATTAENPRYTTGDVWTHPWY